MCFNGWVQLRHGNTYKLSLLLLNHSELFPIEQSFRTCTPIIIAYFIPLWVHSHKCYVYYIFL